jgi:two-component system, cell cycle sensor histidine kinase and response regulator CckA
MIHTLTELREFVTQGVLVTDVDLNILTWNYWLEIHTGHPSAEVIGRNLLELYPELAERGYDEVYRQVLAGEFVMLAHRFHKYLLPMPAPGAGAGVFPYMQQTARIAPLKREGLVSGTMTIIEDVTERVAREAELVRQVTALQTLQEIDQAILTLELDECLDRIAQGAARLADAPLATVAIMENDRIILAPGQGNVPPVIEPELLQRTAVKRAINSGEAVIINDLHALPQAERPEPLDPDSRSLAAIPLLVNGAGVGALLVESAQAGAFDRHRQELLATLATRAAVAIDNARLHQSLRRSEEQYRQLVETAQEGVWAVNTRSMTTFVNRRMAEIVAASPEEMVGRPVVDYVAEDEIEFAEAVFRRRPLGKPERFDIRLKRQDGSQVWVNISVASLFDESGQYVGHFGMVNDISERKEAEARLQASEERLRLLVEYLPEGVLLLDSEETILLANATASDYLPLLGAAGEIGGKLPQLGGQPLAEIVAATATGGWLELAWGGESGPIFQVAGRPLPAADVSRYLLVLRDVTHESQLERQLRQQERLAAVGQLAAGIAHDFNNIVASIILYTELMLLEKPPGAKTNERLTTIHRQAERAAHLVRQILDFSRQSIIQHKPVDLTLLVEEVVTLLARTMPANVRLEFAHDNDHYFVNGDAGRLEQALLNLAVNAQEAMPEGGTIRLGLSLYEPEEAEKALLPEMQPGSWIKLEFSDTGPGIPAEVLPHIFEPFFTTKSPAESTGLGLSQVYGIVRQHGGHLVAANLPGGGALFTIYLPFLAVGGVEQGLQAGLQETPHVAPASPPVSLLLVEDDPVLRQVLLEMFSEGAYKVLAAGDGREALQLFAEHGDEIEVVLTDLVMPDMNGLNLYQMLQRQAPELKVVLMSGYPINDETQALIEQERLHWLQKPFTVEQLAEKIRPEKE